MFRRSEPKKRGGFLPFVIFRVLLSLTMFLILGLGAYQALRYFSGVDPIKANPSQIISSVLESPETQKLLDGVLGFSLSSKLTSFLNRGDNPITVSPRGEVAAEATGPQLPPTGVILKFALIADSHNDNEDLRKALIQAKTLGAKFVIGLGDYTEVGTVTDLQLAKNTFTSSGLPFYLLPGDHDLWDSRNRGVSSAEDFNQVFGFSYQAFGDSNIRFVLINNADNYDGVDSLQMSWLTDELARQGTLHPKLLFAFVHEPLSHPSSDHAMGRVTKKLTDQAQKIIDLLKAAGTAEVFAGDTHFYTRYEDGRTGMKMTTVGAVTRDRNAQAPRFSMVDVGSDGGYQVEDIEIK